MCGETALPTEPLKPTEKSKSLLRQRDIELQKILKKDHYKIYHETHWGRTLCLSTDIPGFPVSLTVMSLGVN